MAKKSENIWIPFSDLMTALMLIFLLIVVLILQIIPPLDSFTKVEVQKHEIVLDEIYKDLEEALSEKEQEWGLKLFEDLTITFENTDIIFDQDSSYIKDEFKNILDEFIPIYISIVTKEKYRNKIREVKIEGHTANISPIYNTYIRTVELSQSRSREIMNYILGSNYVNSLSNDKKEGLRFLLNANGYGFGRALDNNREYVYESKKYN